MKSTAWRSTIRIGMPRMMADLASSTLRRDDGF